MRIATLTMAALAMALAIVTPASAASYVTDIIAGPSDFTCSVANDVRTCNDFVPIGRPVFMNAGDTYTINVMLTYRAHVLGSSTLDLIYGQLVDFNLVTHQGEEAAGEALVTTTVEGYIGPPGAFSSYVYPF